MRILSIEELKQRELQFPYRVDPDNYGKEMIVWLRKPENFPYSGRYGQIEWRSIADSVRHSRPLYETIKGQSSDTKVITIQTSCIVDSAADALLSRRISGCLYLKFEKRFEQLHGRPSIPRRSEISVADWDLPISDEAEEDNDDRGSVTKRKRLTPKNEPKGVEKTLKPKKLRRGEIIDYEIILQAREVKELTDDTSWVVETWFDHPPGFAWETYRVLERELGRNDPFAKSFKHLVFNEDKARRRVWEDHIESVESVAKALELPQLTRPNFVGPDLFWRFSANPDWVMTILLARLIGGPHWTYVWGALEALHGKVSDWSALANQK